MSYKAKIKSDVWKVTIQSDSDPKKQYVVSYANSDHHPDLLFDHPEDEWEAPDGMYWQCQCPHWYYRARLNDTDCKHIEHVKKAIQADTPVMSTTVWEGTPVWTLGALELFALWNASVAFSGSNGTVSPAVLLNTIGWVQNSLKPYVPDSIVEATNDE